MNAIALPSHHDEKRARTILTPEGVSIPVTVASRGSRIGAFLLDLAILYVGLFLLVLLLFFIGIGSLLGGADAGTDALNSTGEFFLVILFLITFVVRHGYFLSMELGPRGATWGKRIVGIRVAARDGGRLKSEAIIARNLIRDIELMVPLTFISPALSGEGGSAGWAGLIWVAVFLAFPFINKDALRAGDMIAGTWVLEAPKAKLAETLSTQGAAASEGTSGLTGAQYDFGEEELSIYGEHELQTLERVLREDKIEPMIAVHETICNKIGWNPGAGDERAFLQAFYAQLRERLENDMRFGKRKKDKFS